MWFGDYVEAMDPDCPRTFERVGADDPFARWQEQLQKAVGGRASFQSSVSFARVWAGSEVGVVRLIVGLALVASLAGLRPGIAVDPPEKLTPDEWKTLEAEMAQLGRVGMKAFGEGKQQEALKSFEKALGMAKRLYPKADYPDGHANLVASLNNLAVVLNSLGKSGDAEPLLREVLDLNKRRYKDDHPTVAGSLNNLAAVLNSLGKSGDAEPLFREALAMYRRLYKDDHPDIARGLNNLGFVLNSLGRSSDAEPLSRDALEMRKRLYKDDHPTVATSLNNLAVALEGVGKFGDAEPLYRDALAMFRRLYKGDHPDIARGLLNLASVLSLLDRAFDAEPLFRDALGMYRRLYKGDHPEVARTLNNRALAFQSVGKFGDAEPLFREALDMHRQLYKGDHPSVATSMNSLAAVLELLGNSGDAEPLLRDALAMRKRVYKGDHPDVAASLINLGSLLDSSGKWNDAEPFVRDGLDMNKRLYKGDHPSVALSMGNLASVLKSQGKAIDAEPLSRDALAMYRRVYKDDHPDVARALDNLGLVLHSLGKAADAEPLLRDALRMTTRLVAKYAATGSEGDALTLLAATPTRRDSYLSNARSLNSDPAAVYADVWASKGAVSRAFEGRLFAARAVTNPPAAKLLAELTTARRRRADLILAVRPADPMGAEKRDEELKELTLTIARLDRELRPRLPVASGAEERAKATPADFRKLLLADAAVVDFLRFARFEVEKDPKDPGRIGWKRTAHYVAFVVTRDGVAWIDLGPAEPIETAVERWRGAITSGKEVPPDLPAKVRELVWTKVRAALPAGAKTVYVSPDAALCRVPWAALPGDKPGTILLEDFAVATIPHAGFLLDKLGPADPSANRTAGALVVGGVKYNADMPAAKPAAVASTRGDPVVKPGQKLAWGFLDGAAAEGAGVAGAAARKKLTATRLGGDEATAAAVLAALPKARYAHLATHGFFADPSFRSVFNLDPKQFEMRGGERRGAGVLNPLVMTGLVFAGANNPKTPGRGIVTGESLIDLDLSGLDLAVLSACETGLGDVAGGEGTFGLQRAFHLAGTRDVVASLWKVPDRPTAALMALFYRNLWDKNLSPVESLRQAQLEIYRNPGKIPELADGFRGKFEVVPGEEVKPGKDGKSHPSQWAAFTLSGPGR